MKDAQHLVDWFIVQISLPLTFISIGLFTFLLKLEMTIHRSSPTGSVSVADHSLKAFYNATVNIVCPLQFVAISIY